MILLDKFMQLAGIQCSLLLTHKQTVCGSDHPWQDLTSSCEWLLLWKFITDFIAETEQNPLRKVSCLGDQCIQRNLRRITEVVNIQWSTLAINSQSIHNHRKSFHYTAKTDLLNRPKNLLYVMHHCNKNICVISTKFICYFYYLLNEHTQFLPLKLCVFI